MSSNDSTSDTLTSSPALSSDQSNHTDDRTSLIEKARAFLLSPSIRHEDETAKRRFLQEKGLSSGEVDRLIQELPQQPPPVPPRTYPPTPTSQLPTLLVSLFRLSMWASGVSMALLLGYFRFLLPRITRSLRARHTLMFHHTELMARLTGRLNEVKTTQDDAHVALHHSPRELKASPADIKSLAEFPVDSNGNPTHSLDTVIYCAFFEKPDRRFTVEELCLVLSNQFSGLKNGREFQSSIHHELSHSRAFQKCRDNNLEYWTLSLDANLIPPSTSPPTAPLTRYLEDLRNALSQGHRVHDKYNYTFKSLTDLTGFLSRETYALPNTSFLHGIPSGRPLGPAEEDVRREIRALKGLVLNRRSFVPTPHRQLTASSAATPSLEQAVQ